LRDKRHRMLEAVGVAVGILWRVSDRERKGMSDRGMSDNDRKRGVDFPWNKKER
jgi:hypothetical protein